MTHINKTMLEAYRVTVDGEYALIAIQGWQSQDARPIDAGELVIHSSLGSWGYQWNNMGLPLKRFLASVSFDYLMGKLTSGKHREFDFAASLACWRRHVIAARRARQLTSDEFREVWDETCLQRACGIELFMERLSHSQPVTARECGLWDGLSTYAVSRNNPRVDRFWQLLWPAFVEQLQRELTPANERFAA